MVTKAIQGVNYDFQRHHLLPNAVMNSTLFMRDLLSSNHWNRDSHTDNLIALPTAAGTGVTVHNGSHPAYSNWYGAIFADIDVEYRSLPASTRKDFLETTANELKGINNWLKKQFIDPTVTTQ